MARFTHRPQVLARAVQGVAVDMIDFGREIATASTLESVIRQDGFERVSAKRRRNRVAPASRRAPHSSCLVSTRGTAGRRKA